MEGDPPHKPEWVRAAFRTLAWYHATVKDFHPLDAHALPEYPIWLDPRQPGKALKALEEERGDFRAGTSTDLVGNAMELREEAERVYRLVFEEEWPILEAQIKRLQEHLGSSYDRLPQLALHADYTLTNVLFEPEKPRVTAVLDFDGSFIGPRIYDLAIAGIGWTTAREGKADLAAYQTALLTYLAANPELTDLELDNLKEAWRWALLQYVLFNLRYLQLHHGEALEGGRARLEMKLALLKRLDEPSFVEEWSRLIRNAKLYRAQAVNWKLPDRFHPPTAVIIGAGLLGKGFLADILHWRNGWDLVFVDHLDVTGPMQRNTAGGTYTITELREAPRIEIVANYTGLGTEDLDAVGKACLEADWIFTSAGARPLEGRQLVNLLASAVASRAGAGILRPLHIVISEMLPRGKSAHPPLERAVHDALSPGFQVYMKERVHFALAVANIIVPAQKETGAPGTLEMKVEGGDFDLFVQSKRVEGGDKEVKLIHSTPPAGVIPISGFDFVKARDKELLLRGLLVASLGYLSLERGHTTLSNGMKDARIAPVMKKLVEEMADLLAGRLQRAKEELQAEGEEILRRVTDPQLHDTAARAARDPLRKLRATERFGWALTAVYRRRIAAPEFDAPALRLAVAAAARAAQEELKRPDMAGDLPHWEKRRKRMESRRIILPIEKEAFERAWVDLLVPTLSSPPPEASKSGLEEKTGYVAVGGAVAAVPREAWNQTYGVAVGLEQTRAAIQEGASPGRLIAVAVGLEEAEAIQRLGVPEIQILPAKSYASLEETIRAAQWLAQEMLRVIDGLSSWLVLKIEGATPQAVRRLIQSFPADWQEGLTAGLEEKILELEELAHVGV